MRTFSSLASTITFPLISSGADEVVALVEDAVVDSVFAVVDSVFAVVDALFCVTVTYPPFTQPFLSLLTVMKYHFSLPTVLTLEKL